MEMNPRITLKGASDFDYGWPIVSVRLTNSGSRFLCVESPYEYKDALKNWATKHGGKWHPGLKIWHAPESIAAAIDLILNKEITRSGLLNIEGLSDYWEDVIKRSRLELLSGGNGSTLSDDEENTADDEPSETLPTTLFIKIGTVDGQPTTLKFKVGEADFEFWMSQVRSFGSKFDWDTKWWHLPFDARCFCELKFAEQSRKEVGQFDMSPLAKKIYDQMRPHPGGHSLWDKNSARWKSEDEYLAAIYQSPPENTNV
jgi:hypothetical protein